jgi:hypothetical protein
MSQSIVNVELTTPSFIGVIDIWVDVLFKGISTFSSFDKVMLFNFCSIKDSQYHFWILSNFNEFFPLLFNLLLYNNMKNLKFESLHRFSW